jgi:hypothetical protein
MSSNTMNQSAANPLLHFRPYVAELKELASIARELPAKRSAILAALDGQPSKQLRTVVDLEYLQQTGSFFTGRDLADRLIQRVTITDSSVIVDPACGVGDLLVACARKLPLKRTFEKTLEAWAKNLHGYDLHKEFIDATKLRLCLLLQLRGLRPTTKINFDAAFPNIFVADGLNASPRLQIDMALMNPPYTWIPAHANYAWGGGTVCGASLFVDRWLSLVKPNGRLIAVLPDVLRTGANYQSWREHVLAIARIGHLRVVGRFEKNVDVDVFQLDLFAGRQRRTSAKDPWLWYRTPAPERVVGDFFQVEAGKIVPHRDPLKGPYRPYVHARNSKAWATISRVSEKIKSKRSVFYPPFVLVRRTSSPSDKNRAVGTLVTGQRGVAVENHLLVLTPKRGSLPKCKQLMRVLRSGFTSKWLNQRIRCRHLTVGALSELPWRF